MDYDEFLDYGYVKEELNDFELFLEFDKYMTDSNFAINHISNSIWTIAKKLIPNTPNPIVLGNRYFEKYDVETNNGYSIENFMHIKNDFSKDDLFAFFEYFSFDLDIKIYKNKNQEIKFMLTEHTNNFGRYKSCSFIEFLSVEDGYFSKNNLFNYYDSCLAKSKIPISYDTELNDFASVVSTKDYYKKTILNNPTPLKLNNFSIQDFASLKYFVIVKDKNIKYLLPKIIKDEVIDLALSEDLAMSNEQANLLNHLIGNDIVMRNAELGNFYDLERVWGEESSTREWVYERLNPYIQKGIIATKEIVNPKRRKYKDLLFFENTKLMKFLINNELNSGELKTCKSIAR